MIIKKGKNVGYKISPEVEVARDVFQDRANSLSAALCRIMIEKGIDPDTDKDEPLLKLFNEINRIESEAYSYLTIDEVNKAEEQLSKIRSEINELQ
ncbi:MAG: hypothetical protein IKH71_07730 [Oscillospiraceae bacterium]|nr:hypothetical protein [Oscillospiraceae bacterium]